MFSSHSSISGYDKNNLLLVIIAILPEQNLTSWDLYPLLQEQLKKGTVFTHSCSHTLSSHSLISATQEASY